MCQNRRDLSPLRAEQRKRPRGRGEDLQSIHEQYRVKIEAKTVLAQEGSQQLHVAKRDLEAAHALLDTKRSRMKEMESSLNDFKIEIAKLKTKTDSDHERYIVLSEDLRTQTDRINELERVNRDLRTRNSALVDAASKARNGHWLQVVVPLRLRPCPRPRGESTSKASAGRRAHGYGRCQI